MCITVQTIGLDLVLDQMIVLHLVPENPRHRQTKESTLKTHGTAINRIRP